MSKHRSVVGHFREFTRTPHARHRLLPVLAGILSIGVLATLGAALLQRIHTQAPDSKQAYCMQHRSSLDPKLLAVPDHYLPAKTPKDQEVAGENSHYKISRDARLTSFRTLALDGTEYSIELSEQANTSLKIEHARYTELLKTTYTLPAHSADSIQFQLKTNAALVVSEYHGLILVTVRETGEELFVLGAPQGIGSKNQRVDYAYSIVEEGVGLFSLNLHASRPWQLDCSSGNITIHTTLSGITWNEALVMVGETGDAAAEKDGDLLDIRPPGWSWGATERQRFAIVRIPKLTAQQRQQLLARTELDPEQRALPNDEPVRLPEWKQELVHETAGLIRYGIDYTRFANPTELSTLRDPSSRGPLLDAREGAAAVSPSAPLPATFPVQRKQRAELSVIPAQRRLAHWPTHPPSSLAHRLWEHVVAPAKAVGSVQRSIGTATGRDFSSITAWEAACGDASSCDLATVAEIARGIAYNDSTFTENVVIDSFTNTNATAYPHLTVAESDRHTGVAGTGVVLSPSTPGHGFYIESDFVTIEWFEVTNWSENTAGSYSGYSIGALSATIQYTLIYSDGHGTEANSDADAVYIRYGGDGAVIRNSTVYDIARSGIHHNTADASTLVENVTVYRAAISDGSTTNAAFVVRGLGGFMTVINSIGIDTNDGSWSDFREVTSGLFTARSANNISSDTTAPGTNSLHSKTAAAQFQVLSTGSEDLHLKAGSDAIDAGLHLSHLVTDIDSGRRPAGPRHDIGSDEFGSAIDLSSPAPHVTWQFDEGYGQRVNDTSGSQNSGSISGASWQPESLCVSGKCLFFDGTDDVVQARGASERDLDITGDLTISFWARVSSVAASQVVLTKEDSSSWNTPYQVSIDTTSTPTWNYYHHSNGGDWNSSLKFDEYTIEPDVWRHVGFVRDVSSRTVTLYIDGEAIQALTYSTGDLPARSPDQVLIVGQDTQELDQDYQGFLDELTITAAANSDTHMKQAYAGGMGTLSAPVPESLGQGVLSHGLVGYWSMDEAISGAGESILDTSGRNLDGTTASPNGTGMDCAVSGKFGTGCDFDGTDDYIQTSAPAISAYPLSVTAWVRPDSASGTAIYLGDSTSSAAGFTLGTDGNGSAQLSAGDSSTTDTVAGTADLRDGEWHFLAAVFNSDTERFLYQNGELIASGSASVSFPTMDRVSIGRSGDSSPSNYLNGRIDEVRTYNRGLTTQEIGRIYQSAPGPKARYSFDANPFSTSKQVYSRVSASTDDAEEHQNGNIDITSSDLELVQESDTQVVGMRFTNIQVPQGATITGASIQFTVDETGSSATNLTLRAQASDDAPTFSTTSNDITNRTTTAASSSWLSIPAWSSVGATGDDQRTSDISNIIQEVINRPGWSEGNSIVVIVTGTGQRVAESYEGSASSAPLLSISYGEETSGAADSSTHGNVGTLNSTLTESDWVAGKYGSGLQYNDSSDSIEIGNVFDPAEPHTVSLWMYFYSMDWDYGIISSTTSIGETEYAVYTGGSANLIYCNDGSCANTASTGANALAVGEWQHITYTYDGAGTVRFYVNGVDVTDDSTTSETSDTGSKIIGNYDTAAYAFDGMLDEVRIYDYVRSQQQILQDMSGQALSTATPVGGAVVHLAFDEGYGSTVQDAAGYGNTGSLANFASPATSSSGWSMAGKSGSGLTFDGGNDRVTVANAPSIDFDVGLRNGVTFSTWIKADANTDGEILWKGSGTFLKVTNESSGQMDLEASVDLSGTDATLTLTDVITQNQWHHLALTFQENSDEQLRVYIDGKLAGSSSNGVGSLNSGDANNLLIGGNTQYYSGLVDELTIYPYTRSSEEIAVDYNQGAAVVIGSLSTAPDGATPSLAADRALCIPGDTSVCNPPMVELKLDEKTGETANDTSGSQVSGTISGATWTAGKIGSALSFDGTDDSLSLGAFSPARPFTLSFWMKPLQTYDSSLSETKVLAAKYQDVNNNFGLAFVGDGSRTLGALHAKYELSGSASRYELETTTTTWEAGKWYHITFVHGATLAETRIYVNGVDETTVFSSDGNHPTDLNAISGNFLLGGGSHEFSSGFANVSIDQVRAYAYARTPAQIVWEYNRGAPIAHYKLDECQSATAHNAAHTASGESAGNHGSLSIGATGGNSTAGTCASESSTEAWAAGATGKWNASIDLDGTDDFISATAALTEQFSISAWIRPDDATSRPILTVAESPGSSTADRTLFLNASGKLVALLNDGSPTCVTSTTTISPDQWQHVAVTYDGNTLGVWVNGALESSSSVASTYSSYSTPELVLGQTASNLGCETLSSSFFDGQLDDVRVYSYPLTQTQMLSEMNQGAAAHF